MFKNPGSQRHRAGQITANIAVLLSNIVVLLSNIAALLVNIVALLLSRTAPQPSRATMSLSRTALQASRATMSLSSATLQASRAGPQPARDGRFRFEAIRSAGGTRTSHASRVLYSVQITTHDKSNSHHRSPCRALVGNA